MTEFQPGFQPSSWGQVPDEIPKPMDIDEDADVKSRTSKEPPKAQEVAKKFLKESLYPASPKKAPTPKAAPAPSPKASPTAEKTEVKVKKEVHIPPAIIKKYAKESLYQAPVSGPAPTATASQRSQPPGGPPISPTTSPTSSPKPAPKIDEAVASALLIQALKIGDGKLPIELKAIGPTLTGTLDLSGVPLTGTRIPFLRTLFPNITGLKVANCQLNDQTLAEIRDFKKLQSLDISGNVLLLPNGTLSPSSPITARELWYLTQKQSLSSVTLAPGVVLQHELGVGLTQDLGKVIGNDVLAQLILQDGINRQALPSGYATYDALFCRSMKHLNLVGMTVQEKDFGQLVMQLRELFPSLQKLELEQCIVLNKLTSGVLNGRAEIAQFFKTAAEHPPTQPLRRESAPPESHLPPRFGMPPEEPLPQSQAHYTPPHFVPPRRTQSAPQPGPYSAPHTPPKAPATAQPTQAVSSAITPVEKKILDRLTEKVNADATKAKATDEAQMKAQCVTTFQALRKEYERCKALMKATQGSDHEEILFQRYTPEQAKRFFGVATPPEVRKLFKELMKLAHPDKWRNPKDPEYMLQKSDTASGTYLSEFCSFLKHCNDSALK